MLVPTEQELLEFHQLYEEFKSWNQLHTRQMSNDTIQLLISKLPFNDPVRVEGNRLIRYNRYAELNERFAPFFYSKISETKPNVNINA